MNKEKRNKIAGFILSQRYFLRNACVPEKKWRRRIAEIYIAKKIGTSDEFIEVWDYLEKEHLI